MRKFEIHERPSLAEIEQEEGPPPVTPADALFGATQRRLLGLLYGQPDRQAHIAELIGLTGSGGGAVQRELLRLERTGLLAARRQGTRKLYSANPRCSIYPQLVSLVRNSFGLREPLRAAFGSLESAIDQAFVFDAFEHEPGTRLPPLELLVVTTRARAVDEGIDAAIGLAEGRLLRGLRVLVVAPAELDRPREFLWQVLAQPRVWVFGDEKGLEAMTSGP